MESHQVYAAGDLLTCDLVLAGDAIDYLPFFMVALRELGRLGIGRERGRYVITQVQCLPPSAPAYELYSGPEDRSQDLRAAATGEEILRPYEGLSPRKLTLEFITPTRLKHQGRLLKKDPPFH